MEPLDARDHHGRGRRRRAGRDDGGRVDVRARARCRARRCAVELAPAEEGLRRGRGAARWSRRRPIGSRRRARSWPRAAAGATGSTSSPAAQRRLKAAIVADALRRQAQLEVAVDEGPDLPADGLPHDAARRGRRRPVRVPAPAAATTSSTSTRASSPTRSSTSWSTDGRFPERRGGAPRRGPHRRAPRRRERRPDDGRRCPTACGSCRPPSCRRARGPGSTRRWPDGGGGSRPARSSRPAPTAPRRSSTRSRRRCDGALPAGGHLVDLYGGVGLFAGALGRRTARSRSSSSRASSVADARVNLPTRTRGSSGPTSTTGARPGPTSWWPTRPGRASAHGASAKVAATHAGRLVLVSCDPGALGRDTRLLGRGRLRAPVGQLVDLFPHTSHVEVVSRFDRR